MIAPQEARRGNSSIAEEIENFFNLEQTWREDLKKEVGRKVRARYRPQIEREIRQELGWAARSREKEIEEQKQALRRRIYQGETTGDRAKDIYFACMGRFDERIEDRLRLLEGRLEQATQKQENPLILQIHFLKGEPNVWSIAWLEKPGFHLLARNKEKSHFHLGITTKKGFASWSMIDERVSYYSSFLSFWPSNFALLEPELTFEEASSLTEKEKMYIFLFGQEEISAFLHKHEFYAPIVLSALKTLLKNTDEEILRTREGIKKQETSNLIFANLFMFLQDRGWYPAEKLKELRANVRKASLEIGGGEVFIDTWLKIRMIEEIGAYFEGGEVVWVDEKEKAMLKLLGEGEMRLLQKKGKIEAI